MSTDAYRGAGRPEATYIVERIMNRVAQELGLDPVVLRQKNFPRRKEFPFKTATGLIYDSGNYQAALSKALKLADYKAKLPMLGEIASLNVSVACGAVLYETVRQRS